LTTAGELTATQCDKRIKKYLQVKTTARETGGACCGFKEDGALVWVLPQQIGNSAGQTTGLGIQSSDFCGLCHFL
jgi:hypothetical protein